MALLDEGEAQALRMVLKERLNVQALKKICFAKQSQYEAQAANSLNAIPQDLHQEARSKAMARQYAGKALAWAEVYSVIDKAAQG